MAMKEEPTVGELIGARIVFGLAACLIFYLIRWLWSLT